MRPGAGTMLVAIAALIAAAATAAPSLQPVGLPLDLGLQAPRAIAAGPHGAVYVGFQGGVARVAPGNGVRGVFAEGPPVTALTVGEDGTIYLARKTRIEKYRADGKCIAAWGEPGDGAGQPSYATSLAVRGPVLYVADAGSRRLLRFAVNGDYVDAIEGFLVPSPYFDCAVWGDALLVTDPGNHVVRRYDKNMRETSRWGGFGEAPEQFVGCCNPCNIAILPDGRIATAEKGEPRLKVYSPEGELLALVGPEAFPFASGGMDLAVDSAGRILALEPGRGRLRVYRLLENDAAKGAKR